MTALTINKIASLTGHRGSVYTLLPDPANPSVFYSGSGDGTAVRWNLDDIAKASQMAKVNGSIFSLALIAETQILLIGQMQGSIYVLNISEKKEEKHLAYHKNGIFDIKMIGPDTFLAAGGDGNISLWNTSGFSCAANMNLSNKSIRDIAIHPDLTQIALACSDNRIYILDSDSFIVERSLALHSNSVFTVAYSPGGNFLLAGSRDARLSVWDVSANYDLYKTVPAHLSTINSIAFSQDGKYFATGSRDKTIKIWDAKSFELLKVIDKQKFDGHVNSVNTVLWLADGYQLISGSDDRSIMVWNVQT